MQIYDEANGFVVPTHTWSFLEGKKWKLTAQVIDLEACHNSSPKATNTISFILGSEIVERKGNQSNQNQKQTRNGNFYSDMMWIWGFSFMMWKTNKGKTRKKAAEKWENKSPMRRMRRTQTMKASLNVNDFLIEIEFAEVNVTDVSWLFGVQPFCRKSLPALYSDENFFWRPICFEGHREDEEMKSANVLPALNPIM